jgi:small-conductance mechanosensitive channel
VARSQRLEQQIGQLLEQLAALTQRVAELTERLAQNSRLPPSSDPTGAAGKGDGQRPKRVSLDAQRDKLRAFCKFNGIESIDIAADPPRRPGLPVAVKSAPLGHRPRIY